MIFFLQRPQSILSVKLRLKPQNIQNDIWKLQERRKFLFIPYWKTVFTGTLRVTRRVAWEYYLTKL